MGRHEHNNKNEKEKEKKLKQWIFLRFVEDDANISKIYYLKMIQEQSIGNNLHFGLEEDDTFKYLARACIRRATWCPSRHKLQLQYIHTCQKKQCY